MNLCTLVFICKCVSIVRDRKKEGGDLHLKQYLFLYIKFNFATFFRLIQ